MTTESLKLNTQQNEKEKKRWLKNCNIFILAFAFIGIINGISLDAFVSFIQLKTPTLATAYSTFWGLSLLLSACAILFIPKAGYKKVLLPFPLIIIGSIIGIMYSNNLVVIAILTILFLTGANIYLYVLAPMLSSYTTLENRTKIFARALYANVIGTALATLFDGNIVVYFFSKFLHISYGQADQLSSDPSSLTYIERLHYFSAFKIILWIVCAIALIAFLITMLLKEKKEDYKEEKTTTLPKEKKAKFNLNLFKNKYIITWLLFTFLLSFGSSLVSPYFPIYLNQFLHIDRGTVSIILAFTYVASVLFMMLSPKLEKLFGSVASLAGTIICAVPIFIIIAEGSIFGSFIVVGVGIALFLRSGFANACQPITQALPMIFVSKSERANFNAIVTALNAFGYIVGGIFTKYILFTKPSGYAIAYYISAIVYGIAALLLLAFLLKKYNRYTQVKPKPQIDSENSSDNLAELN